MKNNQQFNPGDIVTLNSGSPEMTILTTGNGFANVAHYNFSKGEMVFLCIDEAALTRVE